MTGNMLGLAIQPGISWQQCGSLENSRTRDTAIEAGSLINRNTHVSGFSAAMPLDRFSRLALLTGTV
jgi:hypothetical protein